MNHRIIRLGLLALATAFSLTMFGKPAKQGVMTVSTADGSQLRVRLVGDEFYHQYLTEDGYALVERDGNFYYGDIDAAGNMIDSGIKATDMSQRTAAAASFLSQIDKNGLDLRVAKRATLSPRHEVMQQRRTPAKTPAQSNGRLAPPYERGYGLFSDTHFPAYDDQKAIVILVEYTDVKFKASYANGAFDYFNRMLNEDGFSDHNGTGCAAEYFRLNSGDTFRPEFDVFGPITLAHNQAHYGGNNWWGNDQDPGAMVKEACDQLDATVNFADYDRDGDGIVDNIFIFYAGMGEASGGSSNTVWPHSWDMTSAGYPNLYYDGVKVHTYGCSNEWESGEPDGVGTFIHEFSHVMGLPDLYATSYTSAFTPGSWSALDYGPYNNNGRTPPLYGAFERYALGWLKPREVDKAIDATLQPISENVCGVIRTSKDTEFFLLENRQQESWDKYIPGHGMLIWHVDYNSSVWTSNSVNNTSSHQYVDIEEADGTQSESSRAGDAFPGTARKTSFTASTNPAMKTWSGTAIDYPITDIAENGGIITFKVLGGGSSEFPALVVNDPSDVTATGFKISWEPVEGFDVLLNVYKRIDEEEGGVRPEDSRDFLPGYRNRNMGNASEAVLTDLEPETVYYFTLALTSGWETGEVSEERMAFTGKMTIEYYTVKALEATDIKSDSFIANWEPLADATDYLVSVYRFEPGDPYLLVNDFADGLDNLHGWTTTARLTYSITNYCGEAVPSLRMSAGTTLTTPVYEDGIRSLKFWHRGNNTSADDRINVYVVGEEENSLIMSSPIVSTTGGQTVEVYDIPVGTRQVMFEYQRATGNGSLAIDDIEVGHGSQSTPTIMEDFTDMSSNGLLSLEVDDLDPLTDYAYVVRATDGELFSKYSTMRYVTTTGGSGIQPSVENVAALTVKGRTVFCGEAEVRVYDAAGVIVARGKGAVTLPEGGLYIVTVPSRGIARKIMLK